MASPATKVTDPPNDIDSDTDYGSDFSPEQEQIVDRLIAGKDLEDDNPIINEVERHDPRQTLRLPRVLGRQERSPLLQAARAAERVAEQIAESVKTGEHPDLSDRMNTEAENEASIEPPKENPDNPDLRSPIERFRTPPKKALSVTDLVSPAWCELQYWYTLTKHGRKRRTPAMKEGTRVHKVLEEQVYTIIRVEVQSREDAWGLRIWNVIQGLRTLRDTGQTRELEIWGTVDGLVVNGVIDELSYICPDTDLEDSLQKPPEDLPTDQTTIADFFKAVGAKSLEEATKSKRRTQTKKVYLCDVKTRAVRSVPSASAFKPTRIQLMLYHRLLSSLATNTVDFSILASRYNLNATKVLSDEFIAQVGSLNDELFYDAPADPDSQNTSPNWSQDTMSTLLAHNTLNLLWSLMIIEFQLTLPNGVDSLGRVLKAEYRSRDDGEVVGVKTLPMDDMELTTFISHEMEWWKGERQAEGVVVEEAFKCRSCDFADACEWRLQKVEEAREKARMSNRRTAAV
ncbi:exonuclease V a 5' deoxyribonuclease-domain-containing protein [Leptodontidium sp. MPI-SDFR-AT-0119]|nr:exonuclease V a 5' deoxyribonuclease-domain-containing protein [Leptodontidium sp. MPI-SDFR-AT-0119]